MKRSLDFTGQKDFECLFIILSALLQIFLTRDANNM